MRHHMVLLQRQPEEQSKQEVCLRISTHMWYLYYGMGYKQEGERRKKDGLGQMPRAAS